MYEKKQYPNVQLVSDSNTIICQILNIFQQVLNRDLGIGEALYPVVNRFIKKTLDQLNIDSQLSYVSYVYQKSMESKFSLVSSMNDNSARVSKAPQDYFGKSYTNNLTESHKKKQGVVYTPEPLARGMVEQAINLMGQEIDQNVLFLDPCCGTGIFLLELLWYKYSILPPNRKTPDSVLCLLQRIIGMDRDPISCLCSTLNIVLCAILLEPSLASTLFQESNPIHIFANDFLLNDSMPVHIQDNLKLLIIGNPPYVFLRNLAASEKARLKEHFSSSTRQFDTYALFFERSLQVLPLQGIVSLVVPDSVLTLQNRKTTRELLLQKTHVLKIWRVGDVFPGISVASVVITAQKISTQDNSSEYLTEIEDLSRGVNAPLSRMPQGAFLRAGNSFAPAFMSSPQSMLAHLRLCAISISEYNQTQKKSNSIITARGIEIGKNGKVVECFHCHLFYPQPANDVKCPKCNGTLQPADAIFFSKGQIPTSFTHAEKKPIVLGVQRWHCREPGLVAWGLPGIRYKDPAVYADRRVIIRQLLQNGRICAALPPTGATTTQSVYNLCLPPSLNPLELLAVLNSDVIAAATFEHFSSGKKLFPRILLHVVKDLPLIPRNPVPDPVKESLKTLTQDFIAKPALDGDEHTRNQLNSLVLKYLGCDSEVQVTLLETIREFTEMMRQNGSP